MQTLQTIVALIRTLVVLAIGGSVATGQPVSWEFVGGPPGGGFNAIAFDVSSGSVLAGSVFGAGYNQIGGSLYRLATGTETWAHTVTELDVLNPTTTAVRGIVVNSAGHIFVSLTGAGIFRSTDGGVHFSAINAGLPGLVLGRPAISPTGELLISANLAGVYAFNAATQTWSSINSGLATLATGNLAFGNGYTLLGTRQSGGVHKRIGSGPWAQMNVGLGNSDINDVVVTADGTAYAATDAGLYVSSNAGASWQPVGGPFASVFVWSCVRAGPALLVGSAAGLHRSLDGVQFTPITSGVSGVNARLFCRDALGRTYVIFAETGIFRSADDGATWAPTSDGLSVHTVNRVLLTTSGTILAGTERNGVYRSADGGSTWEAPDLAGRRVFALAQSPWGDVFAGNYNITQGVSDGHAYRSGDDGQTWTALDSGLISAMVSGFAFPAANEVLCSTAWNPGGVSRSTTNGSAWTRLGPPQNIPAYFLGRSPAGDLFIGSEGAGVWRLPAGASVWENKGFNTSQQFSVAFDSGGRVYFGNDGRIRGVCRSIDGGVSFQQLNSFPSFWGYTVLVLPNDDVYVGTRDMGIQFSSTHGDTWQTASVGLPNAACYSLAFGPDGRIYAAMAGRGVYRTTDPVYLCPQVLTGPEPQSVCRGGQATFTISLAGAPSPTIAWQHDGVPLVEGPGPGGSVISGASTTTLTITGTNAAHAGEYAAALTNACGGIVCDSATLHLCIGDADCDGDDDSDDILTFFAAWDRGDAGGDADGDADADSDDVIAFFFAWDGGC